MRQYKIVLTNGEIHFGGFSRLDSAHEGVRILRADTPGMPGKDGLLYRFADLKAAYAREEDEPGRPERWSRDNELPAWIHTAREYRA